MARYINLDALCEILDEDIKTGDERVTISWVKSWLLAQSKIIVPNSADVVPKSEVESIITLNSQLEAQVFEQRKEIERLNVELDAMRGAANSLKMHYEKAEAEVRRLRGILLQFTDIVHKWGAKNNIDTSEISLVPILQEEADSIIKKANQEYASKIFAEIDEILFDYENAIQEEYRNAFETRFAELKKKYTEGEERN